MKILLMCAGGMSTSLIVDKMRKLAKAEGDLDVVIQSAPVDELPSYANEFDVFLLGPQVQYKADYVARILSPLDKKQAVIPPRDYGLLDAAKILALARSLLTAAKEGDAK